MDEIIEEFLVESYENLDRLDLELVELEEHPDSPELIASIFRNVHTIKGTAGFFEYANLEAVAHSGESLLSRLRDGELRSNSTITSALLAACDAIRSMLGTIKESGGDGSNTYTDLIARIDHLTTGSATPEQPSGSPVPGLGPVTNSDLPPPNDAPTPTELRPVADPSTPGPAADHAPANATEGSIRVDVGLLDRLMNLVGELVLARNQVLQYQTNTTGSAFHSTSQQLDLITTELQEGVMKTRMQPIGSVWAKLPRVVRDLATQCGKSVRLVMEGEDTELDKTLIEAIKDPLTHIVRNSVDHGLETPPERAAAGKPETGTLRLRAVHEGGQVIIEISDDGTGLNYDRIRAKAISSGVLNADRATQLTDRETAQLIFRPGFSTAAAVTNVSGRGVGMDVVKTNVEKIGGTLEVASVPGAGTTLTIKIPLTLAIIPALIITCDGDRYLIPQINLVEVLRVDDNSTDSKIEMAADAPVLRLRGTLLPIVQLRSVLGLPLNATSAASLATDHTPGRESNDAGVSIAVLDADGVQFGLVVDAINDTEEIVVKPLSPHLKGIGCFAGTTIMGDGAVSLILDTIGLARMAGVLVEGRDHRDRRDLDVDPPEGTRSMTTMVLVCRVHEQRIAIPLALISRLEELSSGLIERAAGREVIQYRDELLRLLHLDTALGERDRSQPSATLKVLVHEARGRTWGLVVDEIVDVFEVDVEHLDVEAPRVSTVIGGRVTDLVNLDRLLDDHDRSASLLVGGTPE